MTQTYQGGCHCGALRYSFTAPLDDVAHCHCSICRRTTGGTLVTWATIPRSAFGWLQGSPACYHSSPGNHRYFCAQCGAQPIFETDRTPDTLDVTVSSLDHPESAPPSRHIWVNSRLPWLHLDDGLPEEQEEQL